MQFFLTGSPTFQGESTPSDSIGGYISSTEVQNEVLNALFDQISQYALYSLPQTGRTEYKIIVIYNDGEDTLTDLEVYLQQLSFDDSDVLDIPYASFKIGYAAVTADDCGDLKTVRLSTSKSKPTGIMLIEATEDSPLAIPDLPAGQFAGLCFARTVIQPTELTDDQYQAILNNELSLAQYEQFDLVISSPDLP